MSKPTKRNNSSTMKSILQPDFKEEERKQESTSRRQDGGGGGDVSKTSSSKKQDGGGGGGDVSKTSSSRKQDGGGGGGGDVSKTSSSRKQDGGGGEDVSKTSSSRKQDGGGGEDVSMDFTSSGHDLGGGGGEEVSKTSSSRKQDGGGGDVSMDFTSSGHDLGEGAEGGGVGGWTEEVFKSSTSGGGGGGGWTEEVSKSSTSGGGGGGGGGWTEEVSKSSTSGGGGWTEEVFKSSLSGGGGGGGWTEEEEEKRSRANLKFLPQCRRTLGELTFSSTHVVLVDTQNMKMVLIAHEGKDVWNPNFVKMPCSKAKNAKGLNQESRWKSINKHLGRLVTKQEVTSKEVETAIMKYNQKFSGVWSFDGLHALLKTVSRSDNYYHALFPKMAALALRLPEEVQTAVPLLQCGRSMSVTLSQRQISCLLANAFFCTFPHRNSSGATAEYGNYPTINFSSLFADSSSRKKEKLRSILHYFKVVTNEKTQPHGLVTFERRCLKDKPNWKSCSEKINRLHVTSEGLIEREVGLLQVDFASSWIGGGVLGSGLVQEEILFVMNPELIVSRLFTEKLADDECLVVIGCQQFSLYSGYSDSFQWVGPKEDDLSRDEWLRLNRHIVALDAVHYKDYKDQYSMDKITRELNKAYCGFRCHSKLEEPDVATGKWGCGAFNGDPQLKAVIQLMAAATAGRGLAFFTFNDRPLAAELRALHRLLVHDVTVGKLYNLLKDFCRRGDQNVKLFDYIRKKLRPSQSQL